MAQFKKREVSRVVVDRRIKTASVKHKKKTGGVLVTTDNLLYLGQSYAIGSVLHPSQRR